MSKHYVLSIKEINDETGDTREIIDEGEEDLSKIIVLGLDRSEKHSCEIILNSSLADIAALIAGTDKVKTGAKLATILMEAENDHTAMLESALMDAIQGGIADE